mmetsp:Transcript_7844/g.15029  ORF Transcript_7844/g.15029 Transcript_7844/m.15029 type:complete len:217 (+) Transcript_7844:10620-11270(+)
MAFAYQTHVEKRKVTGFLLPNATHNYWQDRVNTEMRLQQRFNANVAYEFKKRSESTDATAYNKLHNQRKGKTAKQREVLFDRNLGKIMTGSFFQRPEPRKEQDRRLAESTMLYYRDKSLDLPNINRSLSPTEYIDSFARKAEPKPNTMKTLDMDAALDEINTGCHKAYFKKRMEANRVIRSYFPNSMREDLEKNTGRRHVYSPATRGKLIDEENLA